MKMVAHEAMSNPAILMVDDSVDVLAGLEAILRSRYRNLLRATSAAEAMSVLSAKAVDIVVTDIAMPGMDGLALLSCIREQSPRTMVIVITGYGTVESAVEAMKRGAYHYVAKPFGADEILIHIERALQMLSLERELEDLRRTVGERGGVHGIIAQSKKMHDLFEFVRKVAPTDVPVMIRGESGTGKELFARAIHKESGRRNGVFLGINTAALPEQLLEAELFGYKRGAFTGASTEKDGLLTIARGGTAFLDEISGMPSACQAKLLRAIEELEVLPLGGLAAVGIDVRFLSATNRERMEGIRDDLFYRLGVMEIRIAPLRERTEDIPLLAAHFVEVYSWKFGAGPKRLSAEAVEVLMDYPWPGNVRELENVVQRAVVVSSGEKIAARDVHIPGRHAVAELSYGGDLAPYQQAKSEVMNSFQRQYIKSLLRQCGGNISKASKLAKVTRAAFYAMMKKVGLTARRSVEDRP